MTEAFCDRCGDLAPVVRGFCAKSYCAACMQRRGVPELFQWLAEHDELQVAFSSDRAGWCCLLVPLLPMAGLGVAVGTAALKPQDEVSMGVLIGAATVFALGGAFLLRPLLPARITAPYVYVLRKDRPGEFCIERPGMSSAKAPTHHPIRTLPWCIERESKHERPALDLEKLAVLRALCALELDED